MLRNYFKFAIRSFFKNKIVSAINIIGLGLGLTVAIFVMLYAKHELSYDKWIADQENIYRVYRSWTEDRGNTFTPSPVANALREEVAGVEAATRVLSNQDMILAKGKEVHRIGVMYSVDSSFFQTVPMKFQHGISADQVFKKLDAAVLSADLAQQIFGDKNPVGESLLLENSHLLEVAGVLEAFEGPTHFEADLYVHEALGQTSWTGAQGSTYVRLNNKVNTDQVEGKLKTIATREIALAYQREGRTFKESSVSNWLLQPLSKIHLGSDKLGGGGLVTGSYRQVSIMILLGIMVLALAIINYINLATARLRERSAEVGVRKVIGASRKNLVSQFIAESLLAVLLSGLLAFTIVQGGMPYFNEIVSRSLDFSILFNFEGVLYLALLIVLVGALTGFFPAYYYASLHPIQSIKSEKIKGDRTSNYRNALVVFQFTLSVGLILFVTIVWYQVDFMLNKELGFAGDQIAVFRINKSDVVGQFQSKKNRFQNIPGVAAVSQTSRAPGEFIPNYTLKIEGQENNSSVDMLFADTDWNKVFDLELLDGRYFSEKYGTDSSAFVVNETFIKQFGLENPIGHKVKFVNEEGYGQIVGIVKDFHYKGLQESIQPMAICTRFDKNWMGRVAIRLKADQMNSSIKELNTAWSQLEPAFPVTYHFIDQRFESLYEHYLRFGKSLFYTTICCVIIALMGLLGLTFFITQQRVKEIGIRKILGASVSNIITLLTKDLLILVTIAIAIAIPLAWYFGNQWLQEFAYRINLQWWIFMGIAIATLLVAFIATGLQSLKVAISNPVNALRNE